MYIYTIKSMGSATLPEVFTSPIFIQIHKLLVTAIGSIIIMQIFCIIICNDTM